MVPLWFVIAGSVAAAALGFVIGRLARGILDRSTLIGHRTIHHDEDTKQFNVSDGIGRPRVGFSTRMWDHASPRIDTVATAPQCLADQSCEDPDEQDEPPSARCGQLLTTIRFLEREHLRSATSVASSYMEIVHGAKLKNPLFHQCVERSSSTTRGGLMCTVTMVDNSKIFLVTWPDPGVAVLDITLCGDDNSRDSMIAHVLPVIQKVYEKHANTTIHGRKPHVDWTLQLRGFRVTEEHDNPYDVDLDKVLMRTKNIGKECLTSVQTAYQRIDVYSFQTVPGIEELVEYNRDPAFAEALPMNRVVLLDRIVQSTLRGDAAYHEALVHPALLAHANPRRVAIIGGGEGATLREVLRHSTVERAVMIEIDEGMVNASRTYLPEWSDCSNIVGSAPSCFNDVRAETYYEDAIAWFIHRFGNNAHEVLKDDDGLDVIIMDALDPSSVVEFSDLLYDNEDLMAAFSNALGEDGIFAVQVGDSDLPRDRPSDFGTENRLLQFRQHLVDIGFLTIVEYSEPHCNFDFPWSYQVAMRSADSVTRFFSNEAAINLAVAKRIRPTLNGESSLRYFDGATMVSYQQPTRLVENVWCMTAGARCKGKHGFDPAIADLSLEQGFHLKRGDDSGKLILMVDQDIVESSYLGLNESTASVLIPPSAYDLLKEFVPPGDTIRDFGWESSVLETQQGRSSLTLPGGPMMFVSRTTEVGSLPPLPQRVEDEGKVASHKVYNPFARRHFSHPSSVYSAGPLTKGTQLFIGKQLHTNDHMVWADPALYDSIDFVDNRMKIQPLL